jgi:hypothetical protein
MKYTGPLCEVCRDTGNDPASDCQWCPENCWIALLRRYYYESLAYNRPLGLAYDFMFGKAEDD